MSEDRRKADRRKTERGSGDRRRGGRPRLPDDKAARAFLGTRVPDPWADEFIKRAEARGEDVSVLLRHLIARFLFSKTVADSGRG